MLPEKNPLKLEYVQVLSAPIEKVFAFFADEKNLEILTPPWLKFQVLGKSTERLEKGTLIDYKLRVRGIPLKWQSLIEEWQVNRSFVDRQVVGPYKLWHHTHTFEPVPEGTRMTDTILYAVPGGLAGRIAVGWLVASDIGKIFAFRQKKISEIF